MARNDSNDVFQRTSFLYGGNAAFLEQLYTRYRQDPDSLDEGWRNFFSTLHDDAGVAAREANGASWTRPDWPELTNGELVSALDSNWRVSHDTVAGRIAESTGRGLQSLSAEALRQATLDSMRAMMLIRAYRTRGHLIADLDPLKLKPHEHHSELAPEAYGFGERDLDRPIFLNSALGLESATIRRLLAILKRVYSSTLSVEFIHISEPEQKDWIMRRIEGPEEHITFTVEGRKAILNKLIEAEGFERFLDGKYPGTKRFGLEGAEAMIPALEQIVKRGGHLGVRSIVLGMAHRGRLNVLSNVMGKSFRAIFHEFSGGEANSSHVEGSGDVKYHLGSSSDRSFDGNEVHLSLMANPSHLEIVDPVVMGKARATQDQFGDGERTSVLPFLIHGDAAFAGQGVVAECLALSGLRGHRCGGTMHFIINNQIGFTTSPLYARSSPYPSDVAKTIEAPIFHVNGDDPEAVVYAARLATEFRQTFRKPVVIDMFCYRRHGHNEGDEPSFTQPLMYKKIAEHTTVPGIYAERLVDDGIVTQSEVESMRDAYRRRLDEEFGHADSYRPGKADWLDGRWNGLTQPKDEGSRCGVTGVDVERLKFIGERVTTIPKTFNVHRTIKRIFARRRKTIDQGKGIDWSMAEHLAFGSLLVEGYPVRLSGQDSQRGTFSQRHAVLVDQDNEETYTPLNHIGNNQARAEIINSMLSEEAVLGFEYGYSLAEPRSLVLWEAQFGDFANGAQVVIDQFISASERKWLRMSGLVVLLPHGYEGMGPEHSSARLERYLQLCAEDNMQVVNCTTPANYFHVLRRQMLRNFRKPLIVMTPKSLLRHKQVVSTLADMGEESRFHRVLRDDAQTLDNQGVKLPDDDKVKRVILCSGKVYYDLYKEREVRARNDVYLLRLEQLYPFPTDTLSSELARFPNAGMVWCQEEPENMGAWRFVQPRFEQALDRVGAKRKRPRYVGRPDSAATAAGLMSNHQKQLKAFLDQAFTP
ncbi:MAG: 2-oxoglutarate dehydrogenase E1 component [Hyphomicrobiales bacterium]